MPENKPKIIIYVVSWTVYAAVHLAAMYPLVEAPFEALAVDACLHAALFACMGLAIRFVLWYAKYETLPPVKRCSNFGILAVLTVTLWTSTCWTVEYVLFDTAALVFLPSLPVKVMTGFMLYVMFVLFFYVTGGRVNPDKNKLMIAAGSLHAPVPASNDDAESKRDDDERRSNVEREPNDKHITNDDAMPNDEPLPNDERLPPDDADSKPDRSREAGTETEIPDRVTVKVKQKIHIIPLRDIVYLQSYGDYVQIITPSGKYLKERTMKYFEEHLPKTTFVRIHRSYIINVEYISSIESAGRQSQQVSLKTGEWLNVSISGYKALKAVLNL